MTYRRHDGLVLWVALYREGTARPEPRWSPARIIDPYEVEDVAVGGADVALP